MTVPDYKSLMLQFLKIAADGSEHNLSETIETLAQQFDVSDQARKEILPSGRQRRFDNRVRWVRTYLGKAHLITSTGRSKFRITERGTEVLKNNPPQINVKFLKQFPEFLEFTSSRENQANEELNTSQEIIEKTSQTPQEILDTSYQRLRQDIEQEQLEHIKNNQKQLFEKLVIDLIIAISYGS